MRNIFKIAFIIIISIVLLFVFVGWFDITPAQQLICPRGYIVDMMPGPRVSKKIEISKLYQWFFKEIVCDGYSKQEFVY